MTFIDEHSDSFAVALLLRVLQIPASTYYNWLRQAAEPWIEPALVGEAVYSVNAFAGDRTGRGADLAAVPANDTAKGLVYDGLQRRPAGPCGTGLLEVKGTSPVAARLRVVLQSTGTSSVGLLEVKAFAG